MQTLTIRFLLTERLKNRYGDIYLTSKADTENRPSVNMFTASGFAGAGGAAIAETNPVNTIELQNSNVSGKRVNLYAGRDSFSVDNLLESSANIEITTVSIAGISVPLPQARISESNTINVHGNSHLKSLENLYLVAPTGVGGRATDGDFTRSKASGLCLNLSLIPYGYDVGEKPNASETRLMFRPTQSIYLVPQNQKRASTMSASFISSRLII